MLKATLGCILFLPCFAGAQSPIFQYGLTVPLAAKAGLLGRSDHSYSPFTTTGMLATARMNGADERSFCWQLHLGLIYDDLSYKVQSGDYMDVESFNLRIEPEVLLPTQNERLHFSVGIGIDCNLTPGIVSFSNSQSAYNFGADIDSFSSVVKSSSRVLLPFISAGLVYRFNRHYQAGCKLRQMLRNSFDRNTSVTYYINQDAHKLTLSYQPTFLEFSLTCFIKSRGKE